MQKIKDIRVQLVLLFVVFLVLFLRAFLTIDPDFGWHLQMGKYLLSYGIPSTDPFSYTMSSYHFVDHEWLTNIFFYVAHSIFGKFWMAIYVSLLGAIAVGLSALSGYNGTIKKLYASLKGKDAYLIFGTVFASTASLAIFYGIRPQIQSWVLLSVLLFTLTVEPVRKKFYVYIPLLILFWTNLHGSFALGIAVLGFYESVKMLFEKKLDLKIIAVIVVSICITIINPYGVRIWWEVWMQMSDSQLRWRITEWLPAFFYFEPTMWLYLTFSTSVIIYARKKLSKPHLALAFVVLIQAVLSIRHVPLFIIISLPLVLRSITVFSSSVIKNKEIEKRYQLVGKLFVTVVLYVSLLNSPIVLSGVFRQTEEMYYPRYAIEYLKSDLPEGNIFSLYQWGGYLLWNVPEKKTFIDGRMPSWRRSVAPEAESVNIMNEYFDILAGKLDFEDYSRRYSINTVLWPKRVLVMPDIIQTLRWFFKIDTQEAFIFEEYLESSQDWEKVYEDQVSVIYQRASIE